MSTVSEWRPDLLAAERRWAPYALAGTVLALGTFAILMPEGVVLAFVGAAVMIMGIFVAGFLDVRGWRRRLTDAHLRVDGTTLHFASRGRPRSVDLADQEVVRLTMGATSAMGMVLFDGTKIMVSRDRRWGPDEVIVHAFIIGKSFDSLGQFLQQECEKVGTSFECVRNSSW